MKLMILVIVTFVLSVITFNASAGCGRWVVHDNTDYLKDPTFDVLTSGQDENSSGSSSQNSAQPSSQPKSNNATSKVDNPLINNTTALDISGKWLVDFGDSSTPLNLILIQSGSRVQGYGSFKEKVAELPATAIGSVSGNAVSLDIKLVKDGSINKIDETHKLSLTASNGALTGTYEIYIADKLTGKGKVVAARS